MIEPAVHEICEECESGLINPLGDESQYCSELYDQCDCCKEKVIAQTENICSQFMGYGGCVKGIQAKMQTKKEECEQKQAIDDYNHKNKMEEIQDALDKIGADVDVIVDFLAHNSSAGATTATVGPYDTECASYSDPSCSSKETLCGFEAGCNRQLQTKTWYLRHVTGYFEMLQNLYC